MQNILNFLEHVQLMYSICKYENLQILKICCGLHINFIEYATWKKKYFMFLVFHGATYSDLHGVTFYN